MSISPPSILDVAVAARGVPCTPADQAKPSQASQSGAAFALAAIGRAHLTPLYPREPPGARTKDASTHEQGSLVSWGLNSSFLMLPWADLEWHA